MTAGEGPVSPQWLEVGRVGRAHGLAGDVLVTLATDRPERVAVGSTLRCDERTLTVASSRPHSGKWIVHFEGIATREGVEELRGRVLLGEAIDEPGTLWVHTVVGRLVTTADGIERGHVVAVLDNPAHDILVLDDDTLVPVVFIVDDSDPVRLVVDVPEGLFE